MNTTPDSSKSHPAVGTVPLLLSAANVELNVTTRRVTVDAVPIAVSPREFQLLSVLLSHADRVVSRAHLMDLVWGPDYRGGPGTLNVNILRLRHKLERRPGSALHIRTIHNIGYIFESNIAPPSAPR